MEGGLKRKETEKQERVVEQRKQASVHVYITPSTTTSPPPWGWKGAKHVPCLPPTSTLNLASKPQPLSPDHSHTHREAVEYRAPCSPGSVSTALCAAELEGLNLWRSGQSTLAEGRERR